MGSRHKFTALATGITALAVVTAGCSGGGAKPKTATPGGTAAGQQSPAGPTPDSVAQAFLAAWASGDYTKAASYTDNAAVAGPRLASVMKSLSPQSVTLTLGSQLPPSTPAASTTPAAPATPATPAKTGATPGTAASTPAVPLAKFQFSIVDSFGPNLVWSYASVLGVAPAADGKPPLIHWSSAVIHPQLGGQATLKATPPAVSVADDKGVLLTAAAHPSLAQVLKGLSIALPPGATAPASLVVNFVDLNTGNPITGSVPVPLGAPTSTVGLQMTSTLDDKTQTAAEQALAAYPNSGMVVIRPSTGAILAMASNTPGSGIANHATRAPGSTFKTITAAALLQAGVKLTDPAPCTPNVTVGSQTYHNDEGLKDGLVGATLTDAYEKSCNTSFVNLGIAHLSGFTSLADEAKNYFGMNQPWDLGLGPATYCTATNQQVPPADGRDLLGAEFFGQGRISMCPLTMASVAATVATGTFKQPILIPGEKQVAVTPLPAGVDADLQTLMRGVITNGTATSLLNISPTLGAKTGSAEHDGQTTTDSWMIAMDPAHDIAMAAFVQNAGFGNSAAGPAIKAMLHKIGIG